MMTMITKAVPPSALVVPKDPANIHWFEYNMRKNHIYIYIIIYIINRIMQNKNIFMTM